jgi:ABC-type multidrug transport system fused ATPase/permease subunit
MEDECCMACTEHILLESDERAVPTLETARRIHVRLVLHGGLWRRSIEMALIDYFYLSVRTARAQSVESRYVVDLRFVDPLPRLKRRVPWPWIAASVAFLALGILGAWAVAASTAPWWRHDWLAATAVLFGLAASALVAAFHLTTETLTLYSAHGRAKLVAHIGSLGTFRALRGFLPRLDAHLRVAIGARRRSRAAHLRDEMREHFRLRSAGALTEAEYEAAKRRILATHDPSAARAKMKKARESLPGPFRPKIRA